MDYKVYHPGNVFYDTLTNNNKFFQETMAENREARKRPTDIATHTSRTTRPSNIMSEVSDFSAPTRNVKGLLSTRVPHTTQVKSLNSIPKEVIKLFEIENSYNFIGSF